MKLSVVVCAHAIERAALTRRAITSTLEGDRVPDEVLLVLDGGDRLEAAVRPGLPEGVRVLRNAGSGAADARTTALGAALGEVTAFLDDDAWAEPGWLAAYEAAFSDEELLGAGGLVLPEWERPDLAWPTELAWVVGSIYAGHRVDAGPITRPIGASMAARTAALLEVGGFASDFGPRLGVKGSSNEELATFAALARRFGPNRIRYVPDAVVHHFAPRQRCTFAYLWQRSVVEGTSKADVRRRFGEDAMAHDRDYARKVLVPALFRYGAHAVRDGSRQDLRNASAVLVAGVGAAAGYLGRSARGTLEQRRVAALGSIGAA